MVPLKALVAAHNEAQDYEDRLGLCQVRVDEEPAARASFQKGLDLERARDPQSPLCGAAHEVGRLRLTAACAPSRRAPAGRL